MTRIVCPCSALVEKIDDGKPDVIDAECPECIANKGDWSKSSNWTPPVEAARSRQVSERMAEVLDLHRKRKGAEKKPADASVSSEVNTDQKDAMFGRSVTRRASKTRG